MMQADTIFSSRERGPLGLTCVLHLSLWMGLLANIESVLFFTPYPRLYHGILFYWAHRAPPFVMSVSIFCAALLHDVLYGSWLGGTFCEIATFFFLVRLYDPYLEGRTFIMQWMIFAVLVLCYAGVVQLLAVIFYAHPLLLKHFILSCLWAIASYPFVAFVLAGVESRVSGRTVLKRYHAHG